MRSQKSIVGEYIPIDIEPWYANNTTPMFAFLHPEDGKEVWI